MGKDSRKSFAGPLGWCPQLTETFLSFFLKYFKERQRDEWKSELAKTEEEIMTLKQVLASKEAHAAGLKRRLGITQWREFSEDMAQGLKNLQVKNLPVF